jgi:histidine triad (HIT) family protein
MTIFSKIIQKQIPCFTLKEDDNFLAFLDINPLQMGHSLIIPKIEVDKLFDLPDFYLQHILLFAKPVAQAIKQAYPCNRVNIITVGFEVPHAHIHLIPTNITNDINFTNATLKIDNVQLAQVQQRILQFLQ